MAKKAVADPEALVAAFLKAVAGLKAPVYAGVDPGFSGAVGLLCGRHHCVFDLPVARVDTGRRTKAGNKATRGEYDYARINRLFASLRPLRERLTVVVERGMPHGKGKAFQKGRKASGDTPRTAFEVGWATGMWPLFLTAWKFRHLLVAPQTWKRWCGLYGQGKNAARALALELWPDADLQRVMDHNRAEALLLAHYQSEHP